MTDISAIEARLRVALDRIEAASGKVPAPGAVAASAAAGGADKAAAAAQAEELAKVKAALEAEKAAHGQMAERVNAIRAKQAEMAESLEKRVAELQHQVDDQTKRVRRLQQVNATLRDNARMLRLAASSGEIDENLLNKAMEAELEATRSAQHDDREELDAILGELTPLIEEGANV